MDELRNPMRVFTNAECKEIITAFDKSKKIDEKIRSSYKNSFGVYNLAPTLAYADRVTDLVKKQYPKIKFANTYTRSYHQLGSLMIHTDRDGLDVTLSACLQDDDKLQWPLRISSKTTDMKLSDDEYKADYTDVFMDAGYGAVMEGRKYPHWREPLDCGDEQRALFVFYHWTYV